MRQVTSLGSCRPAAYAHRHGLSPSGLRPPTGIAARHPENAATLAEEKHLGERSPARVATRELLYS